MTPTGAKLSLLICVVLLTLSLPTFAAVESVRIGPLPFSATTGVTVEAKISDSGPDVSLEYRWIINGEENFFEKSSHLPGNLLKRGDIVQAEVIPFTFAGERLPPIVSRPYEAINAAPVITSEPFEELSESGFLYQVIAVDPDGDSLIYQLESAPDTMTINASSGLLQWTFDAMPEGVFSVRIIVDDGHGGQDEQLFDLKMEYEEVSP